MVSKGDETVEFKKKDKVLFLFGSYGDGHKQVAFALHEAIELGLPYVESIVLDVTKWIHPYLHPINQFFYRQGLVKFPSAYGYLFQKTRKVGTISVLLKNVLSHGTSRILTLLQEVQPSVVVSTFPMAAGIISKLKSDGLTNIPAVTVITDHTDHSYWIHPYTDQYIVGSHDTRHSLVQLGISNSQISVTGIPIRSDFCKSYDRQRLAIKHGLDPAKPTVLVMGGGYGMIGDGLTTLLSLNAITKPIQLIVVCGQNEHLKNLLQKKLRDSRHSTLLTGYINYVHELMAVSDIMVTKPGGVTTYEAMAMELPMLLYKPIPGQEQDNARFLVNAGVAMLAENPLDLAGKLSDTLFNPCVLSEMKNNIKRLHPKGSTWDALSAVIQTKFQGNVSPPFCPSQQEWVYPVSDIKWIK
jgi:processive 1,2-diacylglycerol beta-glucosyltransferase